MAERAASTPSPRAPESPFKARFEQIDARFGTATAADRDALERLDRHLGPRHDRHRDGGRHVVVQLRVDAGGVDALGRERRDEPVAVLVVGSLRPLPGTTTDG